MTKAQFISDVEAKPNFIKWARVPALLETIGDVEKWNGVAYISTSDGTNTLQLFFMVDAATGEATWQNQDQMEPESNTTNSKLKALQDYLKANFNAFFVNRIDLVNNWAEADVYTLNTGKLTKKTVIVYKQVSNPIAHLDVV